MVRRLLHAFHMFLTVIMISGNSSYYNVSVSFMVNGMNGGFTIINHTFVKILIIIDK